MSKEEQFYTALKNVFVGAEIEGQSGYINLMKIKSRYFQEKVFPQLEKDIEAVLKQYPNFRDELFDKLYDFFYRYFSESGSIYFRRTRYPQSVYEQVYTDDQDVILFWKTHMLYYVKTDRMFQSMDVELDEHTFFFDVSQLEHKQANEKKDLVYRFDQIRDDGAIVFTVQYSSFGSKTKMLDILRALRREDVEIGEDSLQRAFRVFEKQSEVDYFINKDAEKFLKEQFDLWMYQYLFEGQNIWLQRRLEQLQALKDLAYKIIDFIAQFEDELVRIWNKPKFVRKSHYVITLDRIAEKDIDVLKRVLASDGIADQLNEWRQLGMIKNDFELDQICADGDASERLDEKYQYLPLDTCHTTNLETEILGLFERLDNSLDGFLIKSENYQALNSIRNKLKEKIEGVYIDPPFNKESDADYFYSVKYKDSIWATILENKLDLAKEIISPTGSLLLRCDYNGNALARMVMSEVFGEENFRNEIIVNRFKRQLYDLTRLNISTETLLLYAKSATECTLNAISKPRTCTFCQSPLEPQWRQMSSPGLRHPPERIILGRKLLPPKGRHWTFSQSRVDELEAENRIRIDDGKSFVDLEDNRIQGLPEYLQTEDVPIDTNWTDLKGYAFGASFPTENAEELLARSIKLIASRSEFVLDFFLGSGTTTAVAHKLGRKWIGIEMGDQFYEFVLPRMKKVLAGDKTGISQDANWQGGGFFKYYEIEQYEDVLRKASYTAEEEPFDNIYEDPYQQYVFLRDEKLLPALEIDQEANEVHVDLSKLYEDIDLAETLANLRGKWIARIGPDFVEFEDGERIDLNDLDWELIKPLIWW